jgi:hypothetical protein
VSRTLRIRIKRCRILYIRLLLCILGRAVPRTLYLSREAGEEARNFPEGYRILLGLRAPGPALILESDGLGQLYPVSDKENSADLEIRLKSAEAAFRLFTFRESTAVSEAGGRLIAAGNLAKVLSFIRIIDAVEILLLPRVLARRAVKLWRKPDRLILKRMVLYASLLFPAAKRRA